MASAHDSWTRGSREPLAFSPAFMCGGGLFSDLAASLLLHCMQSVDKGVYSMSFQSTEIEREKKIEDGSRCRGLLFGRFYLQRAHRDLGPVVAHFCGREGIGEWSVGPRIGVERPPSRPEGRKDWPPSSLRTDSSLGGHWNIAKVWHCGLE